MGNQIRIYTDGACSGNPGPGGWGAILVFPGSDAVLEIGGGSEGRTTNNRMELEAAIQAFSHVLRNAVDSDWDAGLKFYSDSKYVLDGLTSWLPNWKRRGWKTAAGKDVLNRELWERLSRLVDQVSAKTKIQWIYVKGHSGHPGNTRADEIAVGFSGDSAVPLYHGSIKDYGGFSI